MKKLICILSVALVITSCKTKNNAAADASGHPATHHSQNAHYEPSREVLSRFYKDFPLSKKIFWTKMDDRATVEFTTKEGYKSSATYSAQGILLENNLGMDINKLPVSAKNYLNTKYPGNEVIHAYIVRDGQRKKNILVELRNTQDVLFDMAGNFISLK